MERQTCRENNLILIISFQLESIIFLPSSIHRFCCCILDGSPRRFIILHLYIFLNLMIDMMRAATAAMKPMIAARRMNISVAIATDSVYCDHVWQLATHISEPSGRKKLSWQGRVLIFSGATSEVSKRTTVKEYLIHFL